MYHKLTLLVLGCVTSVALADPGAQATTEAAGSPEEFARRAMNYLRDDRIDDFAKAMHPDALKSFKSSMTTALKLAEKEGEGDDFLALFHGIRSREEIEKLEDAAFFAAFFRGITALSPEIRQSLAGAETTILGHVMEGDTLAHVVYRMTLSLEGVKIAKTTVVSLQKTETGWGMLMTADLDAMMAAITKRFENTE
jgi:hypothetical protein